MTSHQSFPEFNLYTKQNIIEFPVCISEGLKGWVASRSQRQDRVAYLVTVA